jgi:hypothetical protein
MRRVASSVAVFFVLAGTGEAGVIDFSSGAITAACPDRLGNIAQYVEEDATVSDLDFVSAGGDGCGNHFHMPDGMGAIVFYGEDSEGVLIDVVGEVISINFYFAHPSDHDVDRAIFRSRLSEAQIVFELTETDSRMSFESNPFVFPAGWSDFTVNLPDNCCGEFFMTRVVYGVRQVPEPSTAILTLGAAIAAAVRYRRGSRCRRAAYRSSNLED